MKKLLIFTLLFLPLNIYSIDEEFGRKRNGFSVGFFGGYQGTRTNEWNNAGQWGVSADYILSLPEDTWFNVGAELKMTTITNATLSDFGVRAGYGVMLFDMWRTGLGIRFDVNFISVSAIALGKYHLIPYLTNSVVFPMNSYSAVELFMDLGMPVNVDKNKKIGIQGVEFRAGLNWLFKV